MSASDFTIDGQSARSPSLSLNFARKILASGQKS